MGQQASIEAEFASLASTWKKETWFLSSTTQMVMHPAYQQIIGMGREVVPLLLCELRKELGHWFWALEAITGTDPVPASDRGDVQQMAEAWLRWGQDHGIRY